MSETESTTVAQLEETTSKLNVARDPEVRHKLLAEMRLLLAEADRLHTEKKLPLQPK